MSDDDTSHASSIMTTPFQTPFLAGGEPHSGDWEDPYPDVDRVVVLYAGDRFDEVVEFYEEHIRSAGIVVVHHPLETKTEMGITYTATSWYNDTLFIRVSDCAGIPRGFGKTCVAVEEGDWGLIDP